MIAKRAKAEYAAFERARRAKNCPAAARLPQIRGVQKWFGLFERCFFAVRVSTALELRLKQHARTAREAASDREALIDRPDPPEREDRDLRYIERDRRSP